VKATNESKEVNIMDDTLFEEKYALYSNLVFKLSMTYLGNQSDAEDITQDVFLKLFTNEQPFDSPQHERYWVIRVTVNACKNHLRAFWNRNTFGLETLQDIPTTENPYHDSVLETLYSLPPKYRVVLYLFYYEGYSVEEIATILKVSKSAVKMRLKRGREKLKLELEEQSDGIGLNVGNEL
jgi:RNA polymerase sigma-70 factor (ECF subfamily)